MIRLLRRLRGAAAVGLLVAVAAGAGWLAQRHPLELPVAAAGELTLSQASRRLLERFEGPVRITAFVPEEAALRAHVSRLLAAYQQARPDLSYELVAPQQRPGLVRELAVTRRGEVVVEYQGRRERARAPTQARVSAAMERVLLGHSPHIAFVTGHGERDLLGIANFDLGHLGRQLQRKGYSIQPWRLGGGRPVPHNTSLLVVAGPRTPFSKDERNALSAYIAGGGALLWLTEPAASAAIPVLTEVLGLRRRAGVVLDPVAGDLLAVDDPRLVLLDSDLQHRQVAVPEDPVLLSRAAALTAEPGGDWRRVDLLRAGDQARLAPLPWDGSASPATAEPAAGATLALGLRRDADAAGATREQRIAVVGDGDFLSNSYLGNAGNLPFALNLLQWLLASDTLLETYQPPAPDQRLAFTRTGQAVLGLGFLAGLPLLLAAVGGWRWWRLRRG